jgi:hypothetical protein
MPSELLIALFCVVIIPAAVFAYAAFVGWEDRQPFDREEDWGVQDYDRRK